MYTVLPELYHRLSEELVDRIGGRGYFSGSIELVCGDITCRLVLSAVIYFNEREDVQGLERTLSDVVPVWWEFHTYTPSGEIINDFSFGDLHQYIKQIVDEY